MSKVTIPSPTAPRQLAEIQKEYSGILGKVANASYQIYYHQKELEELHSEMRRLNVEGAARKEFDETAAKQAAELAKAQVQDQGAQSGQTQSN